MLIIEERFVELFTDKAGPACWDCEVGGGHCGEPD